MKNYDLLIGEYPQSANEIVLVIDDKNQVQDTILKAIGYDQQTISFDDILGLELKAILNNDYYSATGNKRDPDENNIVYYDRLTVPIGSPTNGIPGYIDSALDENPLSFKKEDVVACDSVSSSSFISTDVKHKNITIVSNTKMFKHNILS